MAVQVIVDFTDEQWALIQKYVKCFEVVVIDGSYAGTQSLEPTEELMAKRFQREVQNKVNHAHKVEVLKATGEEAEEIFIL